MVRLLDGAMVQALRARAPAPDDPLWAARQLLDEPEVVQALHEDYLRAGADIITTNSYVTSRWRMNRHGAWDAFGAANAAAGRAAEAAREAVNPAALIAGSLPPLRQSFRADLVLPVEKAVPEYAEQALVLAPHVDILLAETMVTAVEARGAAEAALSTGKPVWIAFSLHDYGPPRLRGGETLSDAVSALADLPVAAFLINCTPPEIITEALPELVAAAGATPVGAYGNGFLEVPADWSEGQQPIMLRTDLDHDTYAAHALAWVECGAQIVGGCCGVTPRHIARMAQAMKARS